MIKLIFSLDKKDKVDILHPIKFIIMNMGHKQEGDGRGIVCCCPRYIQYPCFETERRILWQWKEIVCQGPRALPRRGHMASSDAIIPAVWGDSNQPLGKSMSNARSAEWSFVFTGFGLIFREYGVRCGM
jgi:hypothetical protein